MANDSLAFANFISGAPDSALDEALMVRMFGEQVCLPNTSPCVLTPQADAFREEANLAMGGGRCEGFAVLSALLQAKKLSASDFGADTARGLTLDENPKLQRELAYWFSTQLVPSTVTSKTKRYTAKTVMPALAEALKPDASERWRIGIVRKIGKLVTGGHSLTPISYYKDSTATGVYWVRVYDNNHPDAERQLKIDTTTDRWEFDAAGPGEAPRLYFGDPSNENPLYLAPVFSRLGTLPCPFCGDDGARVSSTGGAQVAVQTPGGLAGFSDGVISAPEGTSVSPSFSSTFDTEPTDFVVGVSSGVMAAMGGVSASVSAPTDPENPEAEQSIALFSGAMRARAFGVRVTATDTFSMNGTRATYQNNSHAPLSLSTGGGLVETIAHVTGSSDSVSAQVDPMTGHVEVEVVGAADASVTLVVTTTNPMGAETSGQVTFTPSADTRVTVEATSMNDGGTLVAHVNMGGTTMTLTDACMNGRRDGTESDLDCGAGCTLKCASGQTCTSGADCGSGLCHAVTRRCVDDPCADGARSAQETDVDCGGPTCGACALGRQCTADRDCASAACRTTCVASFSLGARVSGVPLGEAVTLTNGSDSLVVRGDGTFVFPTRITGPYSVAISEQPTRAACAVTSGTGTASADTLVTVSCTPLYFISGTVSGLGSGQTLVLENNAEPLTVTTNGSFLFPRAVAGAWAVSIATQPGQGRCVVTRGSGNATADVTDVLVTCGFGLSGSLSGLGSGTLVLENGTDRLSLTTNGAFTFTGIVTGSYAVTVVTQPAGQRCAVMGGSGTATANVTTVSVTCTSLFTIGGTLSGLPTATTVGLRNNGADDLTLSTNGAFTFATPVEPYAVTVQTQPVGATCRVSNGTGTATANVSNVDVTCLAAGSVDTTFGAGGHYSEALTGSHDTFRHFAFGPADSIVAVGWFQRTASDFDWLIEKLTPAGAVDTTFGTNGTLRISRGGGIFEKAAAIEPTANGRFLVGGTFQNATRDVGVARVNADGTLDPSFADGGIASPDAWGLNQEYVNDMAIDSQGRIVLVGRDSESTLASGLVVRLNADGSVDSSFATGGRFVLSGLTSDEFVSVAIGPGDTVIAGGNTDVDSLVIRLTATGALDPTFGTAGVFVNDVTGVAAYDGVFRVRASGAQVVAAGRIDQASVNVVLFRLTAAGAVDSTFGTAGKAVFDIGPGTTDIPYALAPRPGGGWYVAGQADLSMHLLRVDTNGALDTSFGTNGVVRRNFRNATTPFDVGLDTQGRIVACGTISQTAAPDVGCARFNP